MLNKGPHLSEALYTLNDILLRMQGHLGQEASSSASIARMDINACNHNTDVMDSLATRGCNAMSMLFFSLH
jgi:hypothetical protein